LPVFDTDRYDREILRPLRGTHGQLPPSDLAARYAIEPGMDAEQLARHLATVRGWWQLRAGGPDFRAEVCRLLLQADAELAATAGAAMNDPAWWQEQARMNAGPAQATEHPVAETPRPPPAPTPAEPVPPAPRDWQADARARFWANLAVLDREPIPAPVAAHPATEPRATEPPATATPDGPALLEVAVRAVGAEQDRGRIEVSWPERAGEIQVRSAAEPPDFPAGAELSWELARSWGEPLTGTPGRQGERRVLTAVVPTGYRVYVPFPVDGERTRPGRPVALRLGGPVQALRIERRGTGALLSWIWPPESATAEVTWSGSPRIVTLAEYTAANGCPIEVAGQGGTAQVRAITAVGEGLAYSPARSVTLDAAPILISYTLQRRRRLRGDELLVGLTADQPYPELVVQVVVSTGRFLPLEPAAGTLHHRFPALTLPPGREVVVTAPWPEVPRRQRPAWLRCFFAGPAPFTPVDPPVDSMRIT
jgi:hypothetical protein